MSAHTHARQSGFTLIEVLVSVVVLSIGLLGIGKLVLYSSHANDSAYLRSQATEFAYAIIDVMRANRTTALAHGYDSALSGALANPGLACNAAVPCSPANLAAFDLYNWKARVSTALPTGMASVATVTGAAAQTTAVVTVQWDDSAAAAQSSTAPSAFGAAVPVAITLETVL